VNITLWLLFEWILDFAAEKVRQEKVKTRTLKNRKVRHPCNPPAIDLVATHLTVLTPSSN
jgi:hypothetical protein